MSLHRKLAAVFVLLACSGCAQVAAGQGKHPTRPTRRTPIGNYLRDGGGDGSGGGSGL
jgi:hypothetical protein